MKVKATYTVIKFYEADSKNYPPGSTPDEIIEVDREGIMADPELFFSDTDSEDLILEIVTEQ